LEGITPNAGDAVGYRHTRQTTAIFEGANPDAGDAVPNRHARQATTALEGMISNAGDTVGDRYARQTSAASDGIITNSSNRFPLVTGWDHQRTGRIFIAVRNGNTVAVNSIGQGSIGIHRLGVNGHQTETEQGSSHKQRPSDGPHRTSNRLIYLTVHHLLFYRLNFRLRHSTP
jgi:hypothetical protein